MTVTGAQRLKAELHRLKTVERPAVIQALAEARTHGDLSENADYDAAKERQGFLEGRIAEVESKLANAQIIEPSEIDSDGSIMFGATVERPANSAAIGEARAHGDLSENAEYHAARERAGFIEGRISELEAKLANAQVIDPKLVEAEGRCVFGATVDVEDESGDASTWQIVGEDEADIKAGRISISSPIARALIGKESGEAFEVQTPGGLKRYEIVDVRYE